MSDRQELARLFAAALGARASPADRLVNHLSLDKGWCPPAAARRLVGWALASGVLKRGDDGLRLAVEPPALPLDYRPPADLAARAPEDAERHLAGPGGAQATPLAAPSSLSGEDPFAGVLARLEARGAPRDELLAGLNALPERTRELLRPEAALLLVAARRGLDVAEEASELSARLFRR